MKTSTVILMIMTAAVVGCSDRSSARFGESKVPIDALMTNAVQYLNERGFANPRVVENSTVTDMKQRFGFAVGMDPEPTNVVFIVADRRNGRCCFATESDIQERQEEINYRTRPSSVRR